MKALLIGREPGADLGLDYVREGPYEAVVIGSLELGQLLRFREERVLAALDQGKAVYLYTPAPGKKPCLGRKPGFRPAGTEKLGCPLH